MKTTTINYLLFAELIVFILFLIYLIYYYIKYRDLDAFKDSIIIVFLFL